MVIAIPKEVLPGENRVSIVPDVAAKLIKKGFTLKVEKDAGISAGFTNEKYIEAGAEIVNSLTELYNADIILKVQRPVEHPNGKHETEFIKEGSFLIAFMYTLHYSDLAKMYANHGINVISMDAIPRTTLAQKMDALSSQANIAGYKSVLLAANALGKIFPLMMTAAGTIQPAKVVIMGAGVAGLQALG
ncbi:MAG: NAD(P)(+) transhydrogenase (Re/Si-specific) subunit alpha, partial [Melioribacteraceae bacterium]